MQIVELVRADCIKVPLEATTREGAIEELASLLAARHEVEAGDEFVKEIIAREAKVPTTTMVAGMAFPHEASRSARRRCLSVGKFKSPIPWGKDSERRVGVVFLFTLPKGDKDGRVEILKMLTQSLGSEIIQRRLSKARSAADIYNILVRIGRDLDIPPSFKLRRVLRGHSDVIHSLSWSPDGEKLASGGAGPDQARVWDSELGDLSALLGGHAGSIFSVRWSPNGRLLASACSDNIVRLWETEKFSLRQTLNSQDQVYGISWSQDSRMLAVASHLCMVRIWDCETGMPQPGIEEAFNIGYCVGWSPDGRWIAAGGGRMEPSVRMWDAQTGQLKKSLIIPTGAIFTVAWSPDGTMLGAGSANGSILIIEAGTWRQKAVLSGHRAQLTGLDFSHDGEFLASKADDGTVCLWHGRTWNELARVPECGGMHRLFNGIAFHPRTVRLATLGESGQSIRIWDLDREKILGPGGEPFGEKAPITAIAATAMTIDRKEKAGKYDVFLCHNSQDKPAVMTIGRRLKDRGILPWLDEWNVRPGFSWLKEMEKQINNIRSAVVFVGKNDFGPWQQREVYAFIQQFVSRQCPVIPVILKDCEQPPELPALLADLKWVDLRKDDPDPMSELIWGITGERGGEGQGVGEGLD